MVTGCQGEAAPGLRPQVVLGILAPFFDYYAGLPADFRATREGLAAAVVKQLETIAEVIYPGLVENEAQARQAGALFAQRTVDAVLVLQTMATLGAVGWAALEAVQVPVVILSLTEVATTPPGYDPAALVAHSATVGTLALTNTLLRRERIFTVLSSQATDPALTSQVQAALATVLAVPRLRQARLGLVSEAFPGMTDIELDVDALQQVLGTTVVRIEPAEVSQAFHDVPQEQVQQELAQVRTRHQVAELTGEELARSVRLHHALAALTKRHRLDGGALNCHGAALRNNPQVGIVACYAASSQTAAGCPWACTGDLPTAVALLVAKLLSGHALYCETDLIDRERNLMLLANSGEHDFTMGPARLVRNRFYQGLAGRAAAVAGQCRVGPATLLAFTPHPAARGGFRLVAAPGEVVPVEPTALPVTHAFFRFAHLPVDAAFQRWAELGANHHAALALGAIEGAAVRLAELAGIECVLTSQRR